MTDKEGMTVRNKTPRNTIVRIKPVFTPGIVNRMNNKMINKMINRIAKTATALCLLTVTLLCALSFASLAGLYARAQGGNTVYTNPDTHFTVYMDDASDLLTEEEEQKLAEQMKAITAYGNAGFVSCDNTSETTEDYSASRYYSLFGTESGALLVIDMGNRMLYLKNNGKISEIVTNAYSNTITDNIYRYAYNGDFYTCASTAFDQVGTLMEGGKIAQPMRFISAALLSLILGLLLNYLFLMLVTTPNKADAGEIIDAANVDFRLRNPAARHVNTTKVYSPRSSGGGGGSRGGGGGGFSGGGGSGGGHGF